MSTAQRFQTSETAYIEVHGQMGKMVAKLKNLSISGAFLELAKGDYIPRKGDILYATIYLSNVGKTHKMNAEVVWNHGLGFGVSFLTRDEVIDRVHQRSTPGNRS